MFCGVLGGTSNQQSFEVYFGTQTLPIQSKYEITFEVENSYAPMVEW